MAELVVGSQRGNARASPNRVDGLSKFQPLQLAAIGRLAFYALFSMFPLTLMLAVLVGGLLEPAAAQEQVANGLRFFLAGR